MASRHAMAPMLAAVLCIVGAGARGRTKSRPWTVRLGLDTWSGASTTSASISTRKRLLVAELGANSLAVVDLVQGKVFKRIVGLREPQGVAYAPKADLIYVANAGDGSVDIFRAADLTPAGKLKLGGDADNIRADGPDRMIIGYGAGALAVLDAASGKRLADIPLGAHPELFQLDPAGHRIYVNLPSADRVAVVDRASGKEITSWRLPGAGANFPMALDAVEAASSSGTARRRPSPCSTRAPANCSAERRAAATRMTCFTMRGAKGST